MKGRWIQNITAGSYALILHIVLIGLFIFGMESHQAKPSVSAPQQPVDIVQATVMDEADILQEMARQQGIEDTKRQQEQDRQDKIDQKLEETQQELARKEQEYLDQQERAEIEQQQRELKQQQQQEKIEKLEQERQLQEQKTREAEHLRKVEEEKQYKAEQARQEAEEKRKLAEADRQAEERRKKEAEAARKAEEEKQRQAEQARKEAEAKKKQAELARQAEEKRKQEAERNAQIAEADRLLQESLAAENQEREARRIEGVVGQYTSFIKQRVNRYWIKPSATQSGLQATVRVSLLPGGDVGKVTIIESSGNAVFDRSAESAVYKAAPLPLPSDPKAAAKFRTFQFVFKPE